MGQDFFNFCIPAASSQNIIELDMRGNPVSTLSVRSLYEEPVQINQIAAASESCPATPSPKKSGRKRPPRHIRQKSDGSRGSTASEAEAQSRETQCGAPRSMTPRQGSDSASRSPVRYAQTRSLPSSPGKAPQQPISSAPLSPFVLPQRDAFQPIMQARQAHLPGDKGFSRLLAQREQSNIWA